MQTPGSSFIHKRNPNLHASQEVEDVVGYVRAGGEHIPNEPVVIGGLAVAAAAELPKTPEVGV